MAELRIDDVSIEYERSGYVIRPIAGLSAVVADGQLALLLGPSGCGKTTLLSCLAGLLTPTAGSISIGDTEITTLDAAGRTEYRRRGVGVVFQAFNLLASLTAKENVVAPMRLAGVPRGAAGPRAEQLLTRVGLEDRMHHRPAALSGGQQQRVAIARALVHDPPLVVADEPTANLDYLQVEEVLRLLREIARPGRLVIVATHDERFTPLADRLIELSPKAAATPATGSLTIGAGDVLFRQGEPADVVYVVESGAIEVYRERADGTEEPRAVFGPGEYFGELGPLLGLPRSATARARETSVLTRFGPLEFRRHRDAGGKTDRNDRS